MHHWSPTKIPTLFFVYFQLFFFYLLILLFPLCLIFSWFFLFGLLPRDTGKKLRSSTRTTRLVLERIFPTSSWLRVKALDLFQLYQSSTDVPKTPPRGTEQRSSNYNSWIRPRPQLRIYSLSHNEAQNKKGHNPKPPFGSRRNH